MGVPVYPSSRFTRPQGDNHDPLEHETYEVSQRRKLAACAASMADGPVLWVLRYSLEALIYRDVDAVKSGLMSGVVLLLMVGVVGPSHGQLATAPGGERDQLSVAELSVTPSEPGRPLHNDYFMPVGSSGEPLHDLTGRLEFPATRMHQTFTYGPSYAWFPGVSVTVTSHKGHLLPLQRDITHDTSGSSAWSIIFSPGRVWSEDVDGGKSRASFPFTLVGPYYNDAHNGLATFVYDQHSISQVRIQIVQESANWNRFYAWGQLTVEFAPTDVANRELWVKAYDEELARRLTVKPWSELESQTAENSLGAFNNWGEMEKISVSGLLIDDVIYARPCTTKFGPYPYCAEMRHGLFSVTKSMGALLSMLRLAQKYGDDVFELKIRDFVDVTAAHSGWDEVTFADALNMVTGVGDLSHDPQSSSFGEDHTDLFFEFAEQSRSAKEKLRTAFSGGHYRWGPGQVFRYRSVDTFILAAAMDGLVKHNEGPNTNLWDLMTEEVLRPIGVESMPMRHTLESDRSRGVPILGAGIYATLDDVAKVSRLLLNEGRFGGEQLLNAEMLRRALFDGHTLGKATPRVDTGKQLHYYMSLWHLRLNTGDCHATVASMIGYGGNVVQLLPNGMASFYFEDGNSSSLTELARAAHSVRPLCGAGPS